MPFVLDASIAVCWAFEDEDSPLADRALERIRSDTAVVPALWWFEVWNVMIVNERRGRIEASDTAGFLADLLRLGVAIDREADQVGVLDLARKHRLTAYDASYLELARRLGAPLAPLDGRLARAARSETVVLLDDT